jgi:uncharacterized phiE125 gp8 family phage protein
VNRTPTVITGPVTEPVTAAELLTQLSFGDETPEPLQIETCIAASRAYYEWRTGRTIHQSTLEMVYDEFPSTDYFTLPRATPLLSIVTASYKNSSGVTTIMTENTDYLLDTDSIPGRMVLPYNVSWPSFTAWPVSPIRIRYTAGLATSPVVSCAADIKIPILMLAAHLWENREAVNLADVASISQVAVQFGAEAFISSRVAVYSF